MTTVDDLVEQYHVALKAQAAAVAREAAMADRVKMTFSQQVMAAGDVPVSKAEHIARFSKPYVESCDLMNAAREEAEDAKAEVEYLKTRFEAWRTKTSYAKARMGNG